MKNAKQDQRTVRRAPMSESGKKHDLKLQKNTMIYFQIGLVLCLLGTYALLEMQVMNKVLVLPEFTPDQMQDEYAIAAVKPKVKVKKQAPKKELPKSTVLFDTIPKEEDDNPLDQIIEYDPEPNLPIGSVDSIDVVDPIDEDFNIYNVEKVPVFPGCEKYTKREDLTKCMSEKIAKLVRRKFNTDIAADNGLSGKQRIHVQFTIGANGEVIDIKSRAPHPRLEDEAMRVIKKIPKMTPGYMAVTPVPIISTLPIMFELRD